MCVGAGEVLALRPEETCPSQGTTSGRGRCVESPRSLEDVGLVGRAVRRGAGAVSARGCGAEGLGFSDSVILGTSEQQPNFNGDGDKANGRDGQIKSDVANCCRLLDYWAIGVALGDAGIKEGEPPSKCGRGAWQGASEDDPLFQSLANQRLCNVSRQGNDRGSTGIRAANYVGQSQLFPENFPSDGPS
ncbi:predicted protein [Chaetomium globosum CBS 148.51]|uniref:Uncharacterized protein n=1 Tax=Chaetomium globosum (strain ATCC 6205 / CBS 148.51 / DSM 1962 / NBRC 6347 / NRRL 1970) TaxID=306901 RepID=Q2H135_CHAGB|nr:uncharacterized protein CHGG_04511 [Chaetomium globosum CBS 148.51]EAQ87892.1 predicted protein [Chaetomium globosum CBS 148.51]